MKEIGAIIKSKFCNTVCPRLKKGLSPLLGLGMKLRSRKKQNTMELLQIQESMGDILVVENCILPLGVKTYAIARDTELNVLFRKIFSLPEPRVLIKVIFVCVTLIYRRRGY